MSRQNDIEMMKLALERAVESAAMGEVPVGAVLVGSDGRILASAGNNTICDCDPTGHAEIRVLRLAAAKMKNYRLPETTLYVTLEPCAMCASAMIHARVKRVVFGATDPKTGALISRYNFGTDNLLNHSFFFTAGIMEKECSRILQDFFQKRR
ncbi:MAG: tRNA adenosine(34) deaminase TadA [Desulfobulbaceae bacterium]|nr:tRNA adenosine(34) deaminase TadA [Desulfobulbaceae bacterium]